MNKPISKELQKYLDFEEAVRVLEKYNVSDDLRDMMDRIYTMLSPSELEYLDSREAEINIQKEPREFWVNEYEDGVTQTSLFHSRDLALADIRNDSPYKYIRTFKVREVKE